MDGMHYCGAPENSWFYSIPRTVTRLDRPPGLLVNGNITGYGSSLDAVEPVISNDEEAVSTLGLRFLSFLSRFAQQYQPIHGYLCLVLCSFGLLTNVLNFLVLTRPNMRTSINMILAAIALCDTGTMSSYLIYVLHFYVASHSSPCARFSYAWMNFILFHSLWSILLHSSSIWLVVLLALMRLAVMRRTKFSHTFMKPENVWKLMLYIYAPLGALCVPVVFTHTIDEIKVAGCPAKESKTSDHYWTVFNQSQSGPTIPSLGVGYTVVPSEAALRNDCALLRAVLWINGVCFKLLPCMLLAFSIWGLLRTLQEARERNNRILRRRSDAHRCKYFSSRTTKMLVAILSIFLVTELPQALIATLSGLNPHDIYFKVYPCLGDLLDLLSLLNSGVNFLLYCGMSSRFRSTFVELFAPKSFRRTLRRRRRGYSISDNEAAVYGVTIADGEFSFISTKPDLFTRRVSGPATYGTGKLLQAAMTNATAPVTGSSNGPPERGSNNQIPMRPLNVQADSSMGKRRSTMMTLLSSDSSTSSPAPRTMLY